jgi:hypothetical protein
MWLDNETPGCYYDTIDCKGYCCERGKEMFERYLEYKYVEQEERKEDDDMS